ncbi:MAG TPA: hypothetical protein VKW08_22550 [Xanthobacteraceae bacterium]|nr:hypothetical protein [Xanthobacteraceae bacterium]
MRGVALAGAVLASSLFLITSAQAAAPCGNYPSSAARALKPRIEALRLIEREAADRLKGLDTRPFSYLVTQASSAASLLGEARALEEEDLLDRCPEAVPHVRRVCATAALALAGMLEAGERGAGRGILQQIYGQAMTICEMLVGLPPQTTVWRQTE